MNTTKHNIFLKNSQNMSEIKDSSVDLVITSPPYPMIEMWDHIFTIMDPQIQTELNNGNGYKSYKLMHEQLNKVWREVNRVIKDNGIICINIADATRKIGDHFQSYPNHSEIIQFFINHNYQILPEIVWKKQSNKPNKFMGSGMLPPNAYVTQEHEYILIFRKKGNRSFTLDEKKNRYESAYFWEERNQWFTDLWENIKGVKQCKNGFRTAAYPLQIPYRLINMYSVKNDTVLDPFLGTGTTSAAAIITQRNSIGYEIQTTNKILESVIDHTQKYENDRIKDHKKFVNKREKSFKYKSELYDLPIVTKQETKIKIPKISNLKIEEDNRISVEYE